MEKLKIKHDHTLTNILKVFIFSIFLMLPIFTWLPTAFYYGFNEHATNPSTTDVQINYKYQTNDVNDYNDIIVGNVYHCDNFYIVNDAPLDDIYFSVDLLTAETLDRINVMDEWIDDIIVGDYNANIDNFIHVWFENNTSESKDEYFLNFSNDYGFVSIYGYCITDDAYLKLSFGEVDFVVKENLNDFISLINEEGLEITSSTFNVITSVEVVETEGISSAMNKSWQDVWTQPLFSWTGNNNFEFTINAFTSVFGITPQSYITNYINYLLTLTAIYIVFDIIIMVFVKLTHIFGNE